MHALVISEQGTELRAEGDLLVVARGGRPIRKVRVADLRQVIVMGRIEVSSGAIALVARRAVDLVWLTLNGRFRGRLTTRASGNAPLRIAQYRACANDAFCRAVAAPIVSAKIRHQRELLLRAQRRLKDGDLADVLTRMRLLCDRATPAITLDELRGLEGQGAALYFSQFGKLIRTRDFRFDARNRRPPRDPVNACLSFGYAVLGSQIEQEVARCGLDPLLGFLHQPHYNRASLMLDLLEEFRPLVDGVVLRLINRRQLAPGDFERGGQGAEIEILSDQPAASPAAGVDSNSDDGDDDWFDALADEPEADGGGAKDAAGNGAGEMVTVAGGALADGMTDGTPTDPQISPVASGQEPPVSENSSTSAPAGERAGGRFRPDAVYLAQTGRKVLLAELFGRLRETVHYPPRQSTLEWRDVMREQIYHLARVIEGRDPGYAPFVPHVE